MPGRYLADLYSKDVEEIIQSTEDEFRLEAAVQNEKSFKPHSRFLKVSQAGYIINRQSLAHITFARGVFPAMRILRL